MRALESAGRQRRSAGAAGDLFITPGFPFAWVDLLVTNFHLPKSTLLMLVERLRRVRPRALRCTGTLSRSVTVFQLRRRDVATAAQALQPQHPAPTIDPLMPLTFDVLMHDPLLQAPDPGSARPPRANHLLHGVVQTPIFMPVGTYGTVKGVLHGLYEMQA